MKNIIKYFGIYTIVIIIIWSIGKLFADTVSEHELIQPKDGVECVVVSRMFNTSVDCWITNKG